MSSVSLILTPGWLPLYLLLAHPTMLVRSVQGHVATSYPHACSASGPIPRGIRGGVSACWHDHTRLYLGKKLQRKKLNHTWTAAQLKLQHEGLLPTMTLWCNEAETLTTHAWAYLIMLAGCSYPHLKLCPKWHLTAYLALPKRVWPQCPWHWPRTGSHCSCCWHTLQCWWEVCEGVLPRPISISAPLLDRYPEVPGVEFRRAQGPRELLALV